MPDRNADLHKKLTALARDKPRWGYRRLGVPLEQKGETVDPIKGMINSGLVSSV
jgi:hypothetical protein